VTGVCRGRRVTADLCRLMNLPGQPSKARPRGPSWDGGDGKKGLQRCLAWPRGVCHRGKVAGEVVSLDVCVGWPWREPGVLPPSSTRAASLRRAPLAPAGARLRVLWPREPECRRAAWRVRAGCANRGGCGRSGFRWMRAWGGPGASRVCRPPPPRRAASLLQAPTWPPLSSRRPDP
jgi:hypothetical protein